MPKGNGVPKTILETLESREDFSIVVELLERSDVRSYLEGGARTDMHEFFNSHTDMTLFAPKDSAFEQLDEVTWDELVNPAHKDDLRRLLRRHIVAEHFPSHRFRDRDIETLGGWMARLEVKDGKTYFAGAPVTRADVDCEDGLIHRITGVAIDGVDFGGP